MIVFPVFRRPIQTVKPDTSGEFLAFEFEAIDRIASARGILPLSSFADRRLVPENFDGPPWELDDIFGPCDDWFSADDGREAFTQLACLIREQPEIAEELESPENIAKELDDLARVLAPAAEAGVEFRLDMR
jgi:hypothetical protein